MITNINISKTWESETIVWCLFDTYFEMKSRRGTKIKIEFYMPYHSNTVICIIIQSSGSIGRGYKDVPYHQSIKINGLLPEVFGGTDLYGWGSQNTKSAFLTYRTTHSAKTSFLKMQ